MEEIRLSSYEDFELKLKEKISDIENFKKKNPYKHYSEPLFRGHRKSSWELATTLERYIKSSEYPYLNYFQKMKNIQKDVQGLTGKKWNLNTPSFAEDNFGNYPNTEEYEFMAYLRHHGFPSPLLDWTSSMEVASFFAFQKLSDEENVAIYVYINYIGQAEAYWVGKPKIFNLGHNIKPDARHENQKSCYTMSLKTTSGKKIICNHEEALGNERSLNKKLKKYLIPSKERNKVLEKLEESGVDSFTLFRDEDSLMERLKKREFS